MCTWAVRILTVQSNRWLWRIWIGQTHTPYFSESRTGPSAYVANKKTYAANRKQTSKRELQVASSHPQQLQVFLGKSWDNSRLAFTLFHSFWDLPPHYIRPGYDPLKGVYVSWGPPFESQVAWIFYSWKQKFSCSNFLNVLFYRLSLRALQLRSSSRYYFVDLKSLYLT